MTGACRRLAAAVIVALLALPGALAPPARAAEDATTPILAIVSPLASPVCAAGGSATLLVPILGGLVGEQVGDSVDVADLVLDVIGPLYVVCGELPASPGTRCELDANIAGLWPADLAGFGLAAPVVVGSVVDALGALLGLLGLPPVAPVVDAFACAVEDPAGSPDAPPADLVLPAGPAVTTAPPPIASGAPRSAPPGGPGAGVSVPPRVGGPARPPITPVADRGGADARLALQLGVAAALLLVLSSGWFRSWRLSRGDVG